MRILVVGISGIFGGVEKAVLGIVNRCQDVVFDFLCFGDETPNRKEMLKGRCVYYIPARKGNVFKSNKIQKEFWATHGENYDVIWINTGSASNITIHKYAKKYSRGKIITHSHSSRIEHTNPIIRKLHYIKHYLNQNKLNKLTDISVACSDKAAIHLFGKNRKYFLLNNAIDIELYKYNPNIRKQIRSSYGIKENEFTLLMMGRLEEVKNPEFGLRVFNCLVNSGKKAKFMFVGEGSLRDKLEQLCIQLHIDNSVIFTGFQRNVIDYLSSADCLLLPSFFEGFPVVLIEAQANGLPCLVSNNVTKEAKLTELVEYIGITENEKQEWVNRISGMTCRTESSDSYYKDLQQYDMNFVSEQFKEMMEKCSDG